jgi:hypothetical protein
MAKVFKLPIISLLKGLLVKLNHGPEKNNFSLSQAFVAWYGIDH